MTPVKFAECNTEFARDQAQYRVLYGHMNYADPAGKATFCWRLSFRQRLRVLLTGVVWHQVMTFKAPLQPQLLLTYKPTLK